MTNEHVWSEYKDRLCLKNNLKNLTIHSSHSSGYLLELMRVVHVSEKHRLHLQGRIRQAR
jgi:hypothetical protein